VLVTHLLDPGIIVELVGFWDMFGCMRMFDEVEGDNGKGKEESVAQAMDQGVKGEEVAGIGRHPQVSRSQHTQP
jgi:hypothetical protein